jgi:hypothetical protein
MKNVIINESAFVSDVNVTKKDLDTIEFITVLQEADRPNRNNRIYPKHVLEEGLASSYVQERLRTKSLLSEMGHPLDNSVQRQMTIDWNNAGCIIKEFWWEGNLLKGRCETCNTAKGRDLKGLIEQGVRIAFSLRAQGNVAKDEATGLTMVKSPLQIVTYDVVVNPSHSVAFLEKICEETIRSLYGTNRAGINATVLNEAANIYQNGLLIETDGSDTVVVNEDYTRNYNTQMKRLSEMYIPEKNEKLVSMDKDITIVECCKTCGDKCECGDDCHCEKTVKKVRTEDFLVKNIRSVISSLGEDTETPKVHDVNDDLKNLGGKND